MSDTPKPPGYASYLSAALKCHESLAGCGTTNGVQSCYEVSERARAELARLRKIKAAALALCERLSPMDKDLFRKEYDLLCEALRAK